MKRFTMGQEQRHAELLDRLTTKKAALEDAINEYNEKARALFVNVTENAEDLQSAIDDANALLDGVREDAQAHYDEKSEKWQESDKGTDYQEWISELEQTLDDVEVDAPEDVSEPDFSAIDTFEHIRQGVDD